MSSETLIKKIRETLVDLDIKATRETAKSLIQAGVPPIRIINALADGMNIVGQKYERQEYFLSELIVAGEAMKSAMEVVRPHLKAEDIRTEGVVVIGTVQGDLHDIGKNIVIAMLTGAGFEVHDLGTDVPPEKFVKAVKELRPDIVGMSALLSFTMQNIKPVVDGLKKAGLRDKVRVIVGGAPLNQAFAEHCGADAYAEDVVKGVEICKKWMEVPKAWS